MVVVDLVEHALATQSWNCRHYSTVSALKADLKNERFDLLILDWSLPDGDAGEVIRLVRQTLSQATPILIESVTDDEQRIVEALTLGADDYVVKPLRVAELQARVAALLRRTGVKNQVTMMVEPYRVDRDNLTIFLGEEDLELSPLEYDLSSYLFSHPNQLLTRETLLVNVWGRNADEDTRSVDALVSRLRKKLRLGPTTGWQIASLRSYGYRFESV
ncbi:MAG: response regulator transcription factor [Candidatus Accumulibacter sp.]|uniref:Response regulator transcription factor n=2 Tax=Candidatus Accumulibacter TaxID=327159 RepID=A0A7D5NFW1_9PROT|nr:response regulator transcription factor [Accumulibacter sp.]QLH52213.1 MAG: response regulator transcription factor [Candidatus Accumulibacter cognatus]